MARILALVLCAVISAATALPSHGAPQVAQVSDSHADVVGQVGRELEAELSTLTAEAERQHSLVPRWSGIDAECWQTLFDDFIRVRYSIVDIIDKVHNIAEGLRTDLSQCTSLPCRAYAFNGALSKTKGLGGKGLELLVKLKQVVQDFATSCRQPASKAPARLIRPIYHH